MPIIILSKAGLGQPPGQVASLAIAEEIVLRELLSFDRVML